MNSLNRISKVFKASEKITFDDSSKIVLMSDSHRGDGNWPDDFSKNQNIYYAALTHYYKKGYTYIEIGDGDELWETKNFTEIIHIHIDVFWLLSKFFKEGRLYFIFGNHDIVKKDDSYVRNNLYRYHDDRRDRYVPLFEGVKVHEGIILRHRYTGNKIFLIHGHQVDFLNGCIWKVGRFLVRNLWNPLETWGVNDPTRAAKNYEKKKDVAKALINWVNKEKCILVAGHTHKPMFPEPGEIPYFNDGSCVHPRCITAIEIANGDITLVKWYIKTRDDGTLFISREIIAGPRKIKDYYNF